MGYRVLGLTAELLRGYEPRVGLEGPFHFNGRIVYYDPKEGKYWDPTTDIFLSHDEAYHVTMSPQYPLGSL